MHKKNIYMHHQNAFSLSEARVWTYGEGSRYCVEQDFVKQLFSLENCLILTFLIHLRVHRGFNC